MNKTFRTTILAGAIALVLGGFSAAAASTTARDDKSAQNSDTRRESQIQTGLSMNPHLRNFDLTVAVDGNKAVLSGNVEDGIAKDLAEQIAQGADGITNVDNRILVDADYRRPTISAGERTFSEKASDSTIAASVKSRLLWNTHTDGLDIFVDVINGKVTLTGTAGTTAEKELAGRVAVSTQGVVGVNNKIALASGPDAAMRAKAANAKNGQPLSDSWITSKVNMSLMFTRGVESFHITVTTLDGVVSLNGVVESTAERELAVRVAQDVRGVKKVEARGLTVS